MRKSDTAAKKFFSATCRLGPPGYVLDANIPFTHI